MAEADDSAVPDEGGAVTDVVTPAEVRPPVTDSPIVRALTLSALVLLALVFAWRASLGVEWTDSGHYAAMGLRLAQGGRPFADEMSLQVTGFLLAGLFSKVWTALFGVTALELALRLLYVTIALAASIVIARVLAPSFGIVVGVIGAIPLFTPPYNIIAVSYNTMAFVGFALGTALSFAAIRDRDRLTAALAGAAVAFAAVSYPTLVLAMPVAILVFALLARGRGITRWFLLGGFALAVVAAVYLLSVSSIADMRATLAYWSSVSGGAWGKIPRQLAVAAMPFQRKTWSWVFLALAVVASIPLRWKPWRAVRAAALLLAPFAMAAPAVLGYTPKSQNYVGIVPAVTLISFALLVAVPVLVFALTEDRRDLLTLLALGVPTGLVGSALVLYGSSAGYQRGTVMTGLIPLVLVVTVGWALSIRELGGTWLAPIATAGLAVLVASMLFLTVYKDAPPAKLTARIPSGGLAGLATTPQRAADVAALEAAARSVIRPEDGVLVLGGPTAYMVVGGRMHTNSVWLWDGPSDEVALRWFAAHGGMPRVVLVSHDVRPLGKDPLLAVVASDYREAADAGGFRIYVRR